MKRLAGIAMLLCLCAVASAQIQNKFWGLELSEYYPSIEFAKEIVSSRCESAWIDEKGIMTKNGRFGGYVWDRNSFTFYNYRLAEVAFGSKHDKAKAEEKYLALLEILKKKYGTNLDSYEVHTSENGSLYNFWESDNDPNCCALALIKQDNSKNYWVYLIYRSRELRDLIKNEAENEL